MVDEKPKGKKWLKWLIGVIVVLALIWAIMAIVKAKPAAAAELGGIVSVFTQDKQDSNVTNVKDNLVRLDLTQAIDKKTSLKIETDLVCGKAVVNEGWINLKLADKINLKAGKFLLPAGYASQLSPADQKLVKQPLFGNAYDSGADLIGTAGPVDYSVALVNGDTKNNTYDFNGKASMNFLPDYKVNAGVSYISGNAGLDNKKFQTIGIGATALVSNVALMAEAFQSKDILDITSKDIYAQASMDLKTWEPVARIERVNPNTDTTDEAVTTTTLGVNIPVYAAKLSINYEMPREGKEINNDRLMAQLLVKF